MSRPAKYPRWADTGAQTTEPTEAQKNVGFLSSTSTSVRKAFAQFFNWLFNLIYQWIEYFDGNNGSGQYGDGSDGSANFNGSNTFAFATLSGGKYTLTRDVMLNQVTGSVEVAGPYDFACLRLTPSAGFKLTNNGSPGGTGTGAAGAGAPQGSIGGGGAGGAGGNNAGIGSNGSSVSNSLGGNGGNSGYVISPQTGGVATQLTAAQGHPRDPMQPRGHVIGAGAVAMIGGGGGGGGGSGLGAGQGAGGGGGGGERTLRAQVIDATNADAGFIQANGGAAGTRTGSAAGAGGGGGGHVTVRYGLLITPGPSIFSYAEALGGPGSVGGSSSSTSGQAGSVTATLISTG